MHYLHRAYEEGKTAILNDDDEDPYLCGSHESAWWWAGWTDGIGLKGRSDEKASKAQEETTAMLRKSPTRRVDAR